MGFYLRKAFSFGPLRLNLSRSGLGVSFGVKGARLGIGPRGSYVHMGRGGLYYRQTVHTAAGLSRPGIDPPPEPSTTDEFQEITSSAVTGMVDISGETLLHELSRVHRRKDLFPFIAIVGGVLVIRVFLLGLAPWIWPLVLLGTIAVAICARNLDVIKGTVVMNYSFEGDTGQESSKLRTAFQQTMKCQAVWHVDAAATTSDWKRNAGVNNLERRSSVRPMFSRPPKVQSNIDVPTLMAGRKALYFFPDRLLVYDSTGVGAVSYGELHAQVNQTRFVEDETVPSDSQLVGSTWRFVNKSGGPDRRFNNNRQLPILLYGQLSLNSASGLNELFQYSVPLAATQFVSVITEMGAAPKVDNHAPDNPSEVISTFPTHFPGRAMDAAIWAALVVMAGLILFLPWPSLGRNADDEMRAQREQQLIRENQARQSFALRLTQEILPKQSNVAVSAADEVLTFQFTKEGPNAARRDGVNPFDKQVLFERFLQSNTEADLCGLGFRRLGIVRNSTPTKEYSLDCAQKPSATR